MPAVLMTLANPFVFDQRVYNEAKSLLESGYSVTILAWDRYAEYSPFETIDGIDVIRIRPTIFFKWMRRRPLQLLQFWYSGYHEIKKNFANRFQYIHCHDLDSLQIGIQLKKEFGCKLIYDSHELYLYLIKRDKTKYLSWYFKRIEKKGFQLIDRLIVVDHKHGDYFKNNYGYESAVTVRNTKNLVMNAYLTPKRIPFTLLYIGTLSNPRFILESIEVVSELNEIDMIIAGTGPIVNKVKKFAMRAKNVNYIGVIPFEQIIPLMIECHVVLCMINPSDMNNRIGLANKQFEAMVAGRPIIATKGTRVAEITEKESCGLVVDLSKEALKDGIIKLVNNPNLCDLLGRNALDAAKKSYNWQIDSQRLTLMYKNLSKE